MRKGGDPRGHSEGVLKGEGQRRQGEDLSPGPVLKRSGSIEMQVQDQQEQAEEMNRNTWPISTGGHSTSMKGDISAGKTEAIALWSPRSPVQLQGRLFWSQHKTLQLLVPTAHALGHPSEVSTKGRQVLHQKTLHTSSRPRWV